MLSILFNIFLAKIAILLCFFFLLFVTPNNFFTSLGDKENARLRLALAIPIGVPITVTNEAIEILPLVVDTTKTYQNNQKKHYTCLVFYSLILFL